MTPRLPPIPGELPSAQSRSKVIVFNGALRGVQRAGYSLFSDYKLHARILAVKGPDVTGAEAEPGFQCATLKLRTTKN